MEKQMESIIRQEVKRVFQEYADWDTDIESWDTEWNLDSWNDHLQESLSEHHGINLNINNPDDAAKLTEYAAQAHSLWSTACKEYLRALRALKSEILKMI